ncbi:glycosyltransferase [Prosthecobacter sp. SYSU 5D2]|uniref:glycosyltransferase n=1 Tax=Prosthecobacter sp. SYSU 5D2 TaxID=3134134 RepID=UPI0031FF190F
MPDPVPANPSFPRLMTGGKWLRAGEEKWLMRGVTYGPFKPNARGEPYPEDARLEEDLRHIRELGFNTVRLYELPAAAVLHAATKLGLRLLVGIPWTDHVDFMRDSRLKKEILEKIRQTVTRLKDEPCVAGFLIGNEIEKTLVRWMGPARVQHFLEDLIEAVHDIAPQALVSYATYPSTEYLIPRNADFLAVNLYLEDPAALAAYLQRLQNLAGNKPLVITEFGLDTAAHGERAQAETQAWFANVCTEKAVAGTVWFSYTDEWFRGEEDVNQWRFGLVDVNRQEREICQRLKQGGNALEPMGRTWSISVIVCTYNGTATLRACLESLGRLRYTNFEVLLIDDGSTEDIAGMARDFSQVRYVRQEHAGLSIARNLGASLATGEILAYTDDDCLVDEDWLKYLSLGFGDPQWVAAGGPNIPPEPRNRTEAVVGAAPGAPAHVLLTDSEAEHLPGCNLAIRKTALEAIGGFRPQYQVAGDDVDVCWRLREASGKLHFVPGAMVWHHRRYTVGAYFRQQRGYGRAEALLMKDHPERFGPLGGARWFGGIYGDRAATLHLREGSIFHGPMGQGLFQGIYRQGSRCWLDWMGGVLWVAMLLIALLVQVPLVAAMILSLSLMLAACRLRSLTHAPFLLSLAESFLLLGLCWWQPVLREWERLLGMVKLGARPGGERNWSQIQELRRPKKISFSLGEVAFWNEAGVDRTRLLNCLQEELARQNLVIRSDDGWRLFDIEAAPQWFMSPAYLTVTEYHGRERRLTRVRVMVRVHIRPLVPHALLISVLTLLSPWMWQSIGALVIAVAATRLRMNVWKRIVLKAASEAGLNQKPKA